jgi:hypothetical protein
MDPAKVVPLHPKWDQYHLVTVHALEQWIFKRSPRRTPVHPGYVVLGPSYVRGVASIHTDRFNRFALLVEEKPVYSAWMLDGIRAQLLANPKVLFAVLVCRNRLQPSYLELLNPAFVDACGGSTSNPMLIEQGEAPVGMITR